MLHNHSLASSFTMSQMEDDTTQEDTLEWQMKHSDHAPTDRSYSMTDIIPLHKANALPIARIKRIMKEGEHTGMISADAPVLLAKACEMLIKDLTLQSWDCTLSTRRCTLQKQDVISAIFKNQIYSFLLDIFTPEVLYPKMELRTDKYAMSFNVEKHAKERKGYNSTHEDTLQDNGYQRSGITTGASQPQVSGSALYPGITHCYVVNHGIQGQPINSRTVPFISGSSVPSMSTRSHYANSKNPGIHVLQRGYISNIPLQLRGPAQSQAVVKGSMPYSEGMIPRSFQRNQVLPSQMSYSQQRFADSR